VARPSGHPSKIFLTFRADGLAAGDQPK
jgi:hypothetical protein